MSGKGMAMSLGLSTLFEAMNYTSDVENEGDAFFEEFSETIDDEIRTMVGGDEYASLPIDDEEDAEGIKADMDGLGIDDEDEDKYEKLLKMIPEDDEGIEDQVDELTESVMYQAGKLSIFG